MSNFPIAPEDLQRLAKLVEKHDLAELRYEDGSLRVTLRTTAPPASTTPIPLATTLAPPVEAAAASVAPSGIPIEAPIMGVFYRSPAPGSPPFVEIGDSVEKNQPIGMIEAMKVFSEVLADHAGKVVALPAENGRLVHPGDTLILLES
ncbi:acetyl-CoA carboxylase biotin carboxyl carrier protein [Armatimonas sp.]|uniref:acetyl-CoA carboxylase biotin carboxyl carrier protein n=1 Tax=Armatimonas sp. TaxID=1872638 RepID=UPI003753E010